MVRKALLHKNIDKDDNVTFTLHNPDFLALSNQIDNNRCLKSVKAALYANEPKIPQNGVFEPSFIDNKKVMNPGTSSIWSEADHKAAAVLIAILISEDTPPEMLFTTRNMHMRNHPGEVAFPGGRQDKGENALETALREAKEEIALESNSMLAYGYLDLFYTISYFSVIPVVAFFPHSIKQNLIPNPNEVENIFTTPLNYILDEHNLQVENRIWEGLPRSYFSIAYQNHRIWGATAGMIHNLITRMKKDFNSR